MEVLPAELWREVVEVWLSSWKDVSRLDTACTEWEKRSVWLQVLAGVQSASPLWHLRPPSTLVPDASGYRWMLRRRMRFTDLTVHGRDVGTFLEAVTIETPDLCLPVSSVQLVFNGDEIDENICSQVAHLLRCCPLVRRVTLSAPLTLLPAELLLAGLSSPAPLQELRLHGWLSIPVSVCISHSYYDSLHTLHCALLSDDALVLLGAFCRTLHSFACKCNLLSPDVLEAFCGRYPHWRRLEILWVSDTGDDVDGNAKWGAETYEATLAVIVSQSVVQMLYGSEVSLGAIVSMVSAPGLLMIGAMVLELGAQRAVVESAGEQRFLEELCIAQDCRRPLRAQLVQLSLPILALEGVHLWGEDCAWFGQHLAPYLRRLGVVFEDDVTPELAVYALSPCSELRVLELRCARGWEGALALSSWCTQLRSLTLLDGLDEDTLMHAVVAQTLGAWGGAGPGVPGHRRGALPRAPGRWLACRRCGALPTAGTAGGHRGPFGRAAVAAPASGLHGAAAVTRVGAASPHGTRASAHVARPPAAETRAQDRTAVR